MINYAAITLVININKELVHDLVMFPIFTALKFMALHACTSQISFKASQIQCGSSILRRKR